MIKAHRKATDSKFISFIPKWIAPHIGLDYLYPHTACSYCGSIHPSELVSGLAAGAMIEVASFKDGRPNMAYVVDLPNRYAGELECTTHVTLGSGRDPTCEEVLEYTEWRQKPYDGRMIWHGKKFTNALKTSMSRFHIEHLQDATPEEVIIIERALGYEFTFHDDNITWRPL
jgi:hypothetical protein